jgi:hypothetical protein
MFERCTSMLVLERILAFVFAALIVESQAFRVTGPTFGSFTRQLCSRANVPQLGFASGAAPRRMEFRRHEKRDDQPFESELITNESSNTTVNRSTQTTVEKGKDTANDKANDIPIERRQEESDNAVMNRLLLPSRIGNAFTSALWLLVGIGFLLNLLGYAFIMDPDFSNMRIGTMDERRFREEIVRDMKRPPEPATTSTAEREGLRD